MHSNDRFIDFGGSGDLILFCHANAYPPECYHKFLAPLLSHYRIIAVRQRPLWDTKGAGRLKSWNLFRDDLIEFMLDEKIENVIGMGHSLGGIAAWMASLKRPELFSRLILIDPVIIANTFVRGTNLLPFSLKSKHLPIVRIAARRRNHWPDRVAARKHFSSKKLFQRFDTDVFNDFIQFGLTEDESGVKLAFPREWEARIYGTPPNMWPRMKKNRCPLTIIKAQFSNVINQKGWIKIQRKTTNAHFYEMEGVGHLIPFEKPLILAKWFKDHLDHVPAPVS